MPTKERFSFAGSHVTDLTDIPLLQCRYRLKSSQLPLQTAYLSRFSVEKKGEDEKLNRAPFSTVYLSPAFSSTVQLVDLSITVFVRITIWVTFAFAISTLTVA